MPYSHYPTERPKKVEALVSTEDQEAVDEAIRRWKYLEQEHRRVVLRGALEGNEAMVSELVRQGVKLWIKDGVTVVDRR